MDLVDEGVGNLVLLGHAGVADSLSHLGANGLTTLAAGNHGEPGEADVGGFGDNLIVKLGAASGGRLECRHNLEGL